MENDWLDKENALMMRLEALLEAKGEYAWVEGRGGPHLVFYDSADLATILMDAGLVFKDSEEAE